jgi:hypothetical protein
MYECHFCERVFHFKDLFENHEPICEFFYKTSREKAREDEKMENLPSQHDMYKLVQHMYAEMQRQRTKIEYLERAMKRRGRATDPFAGLAVPSATFRIWVHGVEVRREHLMRAFQEDVFDAIKTCLDDHIKSVGVATVPMRCLGDRTLWVFKTSGEGPKWVPCESGDILYLVEHLMGEFMRVYCEWEDDNQEWISRSIENKELHVTYLCKISGSLVFNKDRKRLELRSWLCRVLRG